MKTFMLWGCVCRDRYENGRIPASSAVVECEFKNIKTKFLDAETLPMKPDELVLLLCLRYIKGSTILYMAKDNKIQKEKAIEDAEERTEGDISAMVTSTDAKLGDHIIHVLTPQLKYINERRSNEDLSFCGKCLEGFFLL